MGRRNKAGLNVFRGSSYYRSVTVGKRTIKDGECAAVWNWRGEHTEHVGPKLIWVMQSQVRFLDRFVASQHQYLKVQRRDGFIEHVAGPHTLFLNPTRHLEITVLDATVLEATETLLLYSEGSKDGESKLVKGPAVVVPSTGEKILSFHWQEAQEEAGQEGSSTKTVNKLSLIPQSFPIRIKATTADETAVSIRLVLRFQPKCLKTLVAHTLDPLTDLRTAVSADCARIVKRFEYCNLTEASKPLSSLEEYGELQKLAEGISFKLLGISFTEYQGSPELLSLLSTAIESRARSQLKKEMAEKEHELQDMQLNAELSRLKREQDRHKLVHTAELEHTMEQHANSLEIAEKAFEQRARHQRIERESELSFYEQLKSRAEVDVTQVLVAKEKAKADKEMELLQVKKK
mmetsp:Transcript_27853/g.68867  ORF Transcript_27853/g.68867 Transcript_27853/m.68867 type:complete len:404 (-) Transcript_27853:123-1334(-)